MQFRYHPEAKQRMASAKVLVNLLLADHPGLSDSHRIECLRQIALYKVSEAEGIHKYRTRLMSEAAIAIAETEVRPGGSGLLRHEHPFERAKTVESLLSKKSEPSEIEGLISRAVGCVVTKDEHDILSKLKGLEGWQRYRKAGIKVIDTEKNAPFDYDIFRAM